LQALGKKLDALPGKPARIDTATARAQHRILTSLSEGATEDTDCPAHRLLVEAEKTERAAAAGRKYHGNKRPGDFWLALPTRDKAVEARLLAPPAVKDGKPLPLVIALHGVGGSGHLFFDGYGRGAMVRECKERGWLLVAPHLKRPLLVKDLRDVVDWLPVADLIDEVDRLYPVDQKRVYLVGHSMGARLVAGLVGREPRRFAAVAALAGGGPWKASDDKASEQLKGVRFFVGVGKEDRVPFAPNWARDLGPDLKKAGVKNVTFKEYSDIEHLLVVQAARAEVFKFLALGDQASDERELTQLVKDLKAAIVKADIAFLERVLHEDYVHLGPRGTVESRAQYLENRKTGRVAFKSLVADEVKVRFYKDTAVVTYRSTAKGKDQQGTIDEERRWTHVFVRQDGRWQLVHSQGTPIQKP
jgi:predicted esterase/ketosteroid isomerase-like protein